VCGPVLATISLHTKFELSSSTCSRDGGGAQNSNLKIGHMTFTTASAASDFRARYRDVILLFWGYFVIPRLTLDIAYLLTKLGHSSLSHSKDTKEDPNCKNRGDLGWLRSPFNRAYDVLFTFTVTVCSLVLLVQHHAVKMTITVR